MDTKRFDTFTQSLSPGASRRGLLAGLASGLLATVPLAFSDEDAAAKKGKCKKKRRKNGKKRKCKGCTPTSCRQGQLCHAGTCHACDVLCPSGNCAVAELQAVIDAPGGTLYVCPGRYTGHLTLSPTTPLTLIGAEDGADPKTSTILDGQGTGRVVTIFEFAAAVTLKDLRITGGRESVGGGVHHAAARLTMSDCTVTDNSADSGGGGIYSPSTLEMTRCTVGNNHSPGGNGGGILTGGPLTLTDCLIEDNDGGRGGGIYAADGSTTLAGSTAVRGNEAVIGGGIYAGGGDVQIEPTCRVTDNTATGGAGFGGGIWMGNSGTMTLLGPDPSPIVVDNCVENCAGNAVAKCAAGGICPG
jgi:predicted outer membrane repeat protein